MRIKGFKTLENLGKKSLLAFFKVIISQKRLNPEDINLSAIKKIILIRSQNRMGNIVLTLPLVSAVQKYFPQAKISYLLHPALQELVSSQYNNVEIISISKTTLLNPFKFIRLVKNLKRGGYNLALDLSDENNFSFSNTFLTYISKAKIKAGYQKRESEIFLNFPVKKQSFLRHAIERQLDLLEAVVGENLTSEVKFQVSTENDKWIKEYFLQKKIDRSSDLAAINIGGHGQKKWNLENFIELGKWLAEEKKMSVLYIWGPDEKPKIPLLVPQLMDKMYLAELLPLPKLAALLKNCSLVISCDTGIMHLAFAVGTTTLGLFLASDPRKYGPLSGPHQILEGKITLEPVKEKLNQMLAAVATPI